MKVSILAVGRLKSGAEQTQFNRYYDLFNASARNLRIPPLGIVEIGESRGATPEERKEEEAAELLAKLGAQRLIALDEGGKEVSSYEFTAMFSRLRDEALDVAFAIGGPDGHGDALKAAAHFQLSLGRMTLPHGLARIVLTEQLYRAVTIMQGHPYHRG
jgi:23S rRNA (pseudouridine1915-N3)-methyltransferase